MCARNPGAQSDSGGRLSRNAPGAVSETILNSSGHRSGHAFLPYTHKIVFPARDKDIHLHTSTRLWSCISQGPQRTVHLSTSSSLSANERHQFPWLFLSNYFPHNYPWAERKIERTTFASCVFHAGQKVVFVLFTRCTDAEPVFVPLNAKLHCFCLARAIYCFWPQAFDMTRTCQLRAELHRGPFNAELAR